MHDEGTDIRKVAAEIEAEVRARRAAGAYPPGFERDLDALFAQFAPPEVSLDFDAAIERAEDLAVIDPIIPVASRHPVLGIVKRVLAKLLGFYHSWLTQQVTAVGVAINNTMRLLGRRVADLETTTGDVARARAAGARVPAVRDDSAWEPLVLDALRGRSGRIAVVECGSGVLLSSIVSAGLDAYGVEPRADVADEALARGLEVRVDDTAAHLHSVAPGALGAIVLRAITERIAVGELLLLVETAATRLAPGAPLVVCSLRRHAWGEGPTGVEADLVPGRPLLPETWEALLPELGFADVRVASAGADAYLVEAVRVDA
jgi:hypothetical protein